MQATRCSSRQRFAIRALAVPIALSMLVGCAVTPLPLEWRSIDADLGSVTLSSAEFDLVPSHYERAKHAANTLVERAEWSAPDGARARLHLVVIDEANPRVFTTTHRQTIQTEIVKAWGDAVIDFGAAKEGVNAYGPYETLRFTADARTQCVALRQYSGSTDTSARFKGHVLGKRVLRGWYCANAGESLKPALANAFLSAYRYKDSR